MEIHTSPHYKLEPIIANRNKMCPFDFYALVGTGSISAKYDGRIMSVKTKICPHCNRKYTTLKYFDDLKIIRLNGNRYYNLNLPENRSRQMVEYNDQGKLVEIDYMKKNLEKKIIDVISVYQPIYPKTIANMLRVDKDTVKDYLYNKLGNSVYKDDNHYWWIRDCSLNWTHDKIYYLADYVPYRFWRYREECELNDSKMILALKDRKEDAVWQVADKMKAGINELIAKYVKTDYLIFAPVPSSKLNNKSAMFQVAECLSEECSFHGNIYVMDIFQRLYDMPAAHEKKERPEYDEQMSSIRCLYPAFCSEYYTCIILDDITTTGTIMNVCKDILIENGMPEDNIITVAFAKTGR